MANNDNKVVSNVWANAPSGGKPYGLKALNNHLLDLHNIAETTSKYGATWSILFTLPDVENNLVGMGEIDTTHQETLLIAQGQASRDQLINYLKEYVNAGEVVRVGVQGISASNGTFYTLVNPDEMVDNDIPM